MALIEMIARTHMFPMLFANLDEERKTLWRDIDRREQTRREVGVGGGDRHPMASEDAMLLERFLQLCQKISQARESKPQST